MKAEDLNKFKGDLKTAIQSWADGKIEELIPNKPTMRFLAKNYVNNFLNRGDVSLNKWIDNIFIAVCNEDGVIDTDSVVDMAIGIFKEVKPFEYYIGGGFNLEIGNGELVLNFPRNMIMDALVGDLGRVRFTSEDFEEFKTLLN